MWDDFNKTDDASTLGFCLHHLVEHAAGRFYDRTAMICANTALKYDALNCLSNQLAHAMLDRGIGRGKLVGVALERSPSLVVALLAVLKTGAAYLPLDPTFPSERLRDMLNDAAPTCILVDSSSTSSFTPWSGICLNTEDTRDVPPGRRNPQIDVQAADLAYVIYTSGLTGRPRGVEITHGAVSNMMCSIMRQLACNDTDRLLAVTTICSNIAVLELFLPLLCGATLVIAQAADVKDPKALVGLMKRHEITIMQATPITWQMLLEYGVHEVPRLTNILCGGDKLPQKLAEDLLPCAASVWNLYGPTEATVWTSSWPVKEGEEVKIGSPLANTRLYVVRNDLSLANAGEVGQLCIGGVGLARGYRNNPKLTRSCFTENPFHDGLLYHTGDLACFEDGGLRVVDWSDTQVKIHGYRVELGDIEATIASHQYVSQVVVLSRQDRLIAYFVRRKQSFPRGDATDLEKLLREWLDERLPRYMIPAFYIELAIFPKTLTGKVDRQSLPIPTERASDVERSLKMGPTLERAVRTIWSRALGHCNIHIDDKFVNIGGDSVRLMYVHKELEKLLGRHIPIAKLLQYSTLRSLLAYLRGNEPVVSISPRSCRKNGMEDIAIVSMACRLPGGITTSENY